MSAGGTGVGPAVVAEEAKSLVGRDHHGVTFTALLGKQEDAGLT